MVTQFNLEVEVGGGILTKIEKWGDVVQCGGGVGRHNHYLFFWNSPDQIAGEKEGYFICCTSFPPCIPKISFN